MIEESPPLKAKTVSEIYESCSFALAVADQTTYDEAAVKKWW